MSNEVAGDDSLIPASRSLLTFGLLLHLFGLLRTSVSHPVSDLATSLPLSLRSVPVDLSKDNLSLYSIPAAYILAFVPHLYTEISFFRSFGRWHNVSPRGNVERAASKLTAAQLATFKRAAGAHTNGLEAFPLFGIAILAANWAQLPSATLNKWSIIYLLLRSLYNPVYIGGSTERLAGLRSLIWFASQGVSFYLLKLSGDVALAH